MKKLIIGLAFASFVAFGIFSIQTAVATDNNVEIVKLQKDDDPSKKKTTEAKVDGKDKTAKKSGDKTSTSECKDVKAKCETKSNCCATKCGDKKTTTKEGPDKK